MAQRGAEQRFPSLAAGSLYEIVEGGAPKRLREFGAPAPIGAQSVAADNSQRLHDTWFVDPIPLPFPQPGPGLLIIDQARLRDDTQAAAWTLFPPLSF